MLLMLAVHSVKSLKGSCMYKMNCMYKTYRGEIRFTWGTFQCTDFIFFLTVFSIGTSCTSRFIFGSLSYNSGTIPSYTQIFMLTHKETINSFSSVHFSSVAQLCLTLCNPMDCSTPGFCVPHQPQSLLKLTSIESVMPSNHLILCHPLLLPPSIFPSIRVFSNESVHCIRWPKYWGFSFSISPSNEYSGLISFRMDWLDLLAIQGTLKSLLQHHSSKHQFFGAQLSL